MGVQDLQKKQAGATLRFPINRDANDPVRAGSIQSPCLESKQLESVLLRKGGRLDEPAFGPDHLVRGDQVHPLTRCGIALESAVVKQGDHRGGTDILGPEIISLLRFQVFIPESKHAREVIAKEMP